MSRQPDIGRLVRELRSRTGLTQEKFAALLGVTFPSISRWENGRAKPSPLAMQKIEEILRKMGNDGAGPLQFYFAEKTEEDFSLMFLSCGQFVRVEKDDLGIGKIVRQDGSNYVVEFFDSPFTPRIDRTHDLKEIKPITLYDQTRVFYYCEKDSVWKTGRVSGQYKNDYYISFPNESSKPVPEEELFVRWNKPILDPTYLLANRFKETPFFHARRMPFLKSLFAQRKACRGMTSLLSSGVDLELHQVEVVRRVLRDPIKRYLLADEVGLGKTIEAGMILRQYVLECPKKHRALIIVPTHLVEQWQEELVKRFVPAKLLNHHITIISHDNLDGLPTDNFSGGLVIVDEAHHLTSFAAFDVASQLRYNIIETLAARSEILLLLSATPVLHNEEGFLHMLHLLDPENYSLADHVSFKRRIEKREEISLAYDIFVPGTFPLSLEEPAKQLVSCFPNDDRLRELVEVELANHLRLVDLDGENAELSDVVRRIRKHVGETYRLHRRLLRTCRTSETEVLLPSRSGADFSGYSDNRQKELFQVIDEWRQEMSEASESKESMQPEIVSQYARFHVFLLELAWGAPHLLTVLPDARLGDEGARRILGKQMSANELHLLNACPVLDGERYFHRRLIEIVGDPKNPFAQEGSLIEEAKSSLDQPSAKLIVFSSFPSKADLIYEALRQAFGDLVVARHQIDNFQDCANGWRAFLGDGEKRLLICDRLAEDGLNLQGNPGSRFKLADILFADLPFNPNRIEQRIGRLDRYGHSFEIHSYLFLLDDCPTMGLWASILHKSYQVFSRSITSLQYLIDRQMENLRLQMLLRGSLALSDCRKELGENGEQVDEELSRIKLQDGIDALDPEAMADQEFFDHLTETDHLNGLHKDAASGWIGDVLHFDPIPVEENKQIVRYRYTPRTLVPVDQLEAYFDVEVFDRDCKDFNPLRPVVQPMSFKRSLGQELGIRPARVGNAFLDAMAGFLRQDDRGVSFAFWRVAPHNLIGKNVAYYFMFDFAVDVEVDQKNVLETPSLDRGITPNLLKARMDEYFPPLMKTIWLNEDLELVVNPEILRRLERPYEREAPLRDYNLNYDRWYVVNEIIDPNTWEALCLAARDRARDVLIDLVGFKDLVNRSIQKADHRFLDEKAQFAGRLRQHEDVQLSTFSVDWKREEIIYQLIRAALKKPRITIDAIGAVFLSTVNPFREEKKNDRFP